MVMNPQPSPLSLSQAYWVLKKKAENLFILKNKTKKCNWPPNEATGNIYMKYKSLYMVLSSSDSQNSKCLYMKERQHWRIGSCNCGGRQIWHLQGRLKLKDPGKSYAQVWVLSSLGTDFLLPWWPQSFL